VATQKTYGVIINEATPGKFIKLDRIVPCGTLEVRKLTVATQFYWRTELERKTIRVPIGAYDSGAPPKSLAPSAKGYSVAAARRKAETIAQVHIDNIDKGGWPSIKATEQDARQQAKPQRLKPKNSLCGHCWSTTATTWKPWAAPLMPMPDPSSRTTCSKPGQPLPTPQPTR
jgi:hypothetical protein